MDGYYSLNSMYFYRGFRGDAVVDSILHMEETISSWSKF
jgi:hypothetical protein